MAVRRALIWAGIVCYGVGGARCACAQSTGDATPFSQTGQPIGLASVATRPDQAYDPLGVRLGVWTLYPSLSMQAIYNDNVYNVAKAISDEYASIRPRLEVRNDSSTYSLDLNASGSINRYVKLTTEDNNLYNFSGNGIYNVSSTTSLNAAASYARQLEPRGTSGDTIIGGSPVTYRIANLSAGINQQAGRFFFNIQTSASKYSYEDVRFQGVNISQSLRNLSAYSATGRIGYTLNSSVALYTSLSYTKQDYVHNEISNRNGSSLTAIGGVQFSITSLLTGRAGLGYIKVDFVNPLFSDSSGLNYDLSLQWNPTQLLSLSLVGTRSLVRSPVENAGGVIQSNVVLTATYELLRNVILSGSVGQTRESFQGVSTTNQRWNEQYGIEYRSSRLLSVTLSGTAAQQRSSSAFGRRYNGATGSLGLLLHI